MIKNPSEPIELPSRGWFYDENNPLSKGIIDIYFVTAHHEDILTSRSLIIKKVVFDKFLEALIATPNVNYDDLLIGDKDCIMIASRILGYGKDYPVKVTCPSCGKESGFSINLEELEYKKVEFLPEQKGKNLFQFTLPKSGVQLTFKLLTHKDEIAAQKDIEGFSKVNNNGISPTVTTRMKYSIVSVNGNPDKKEINDFVDNMLISDSRAFREHAKTVNPGIDFSFQFTCPDPDCKAKIDGMEVPIDETFFWPNS
jgi:hypothetical protein